MIARTNDVAEPTAAATLELRIEADAELQDILVAELSAIGFDAFVASGSVLRAYHQKPSAVELQKSLSALLGRFGLHRSCTEHLIPTQNWNAAWESTVEPIVVEPFVVRPSWTRPTGRTELVELVIDPKMSFGTAHHESTRLALRLLANFCRPGMRVLDVGTGTGILAIAAAKLGANHVSAFDIDEWSIRNAQENVKMNGVAKLVRVAEGTVPQERKAAFDISLANINLAAILDQLEAISGRTHSDGRIIVSGLLRSDRNVILTKASSLGLGLSAERTENEWWSAALSRREFA